MTQVMKLEDNIKVLMSKRAEDQSEREKLIKVSYLDFISHSNVGSISGVV